MNKKPIIVYWSPNSPKPSNADYDIKDFNDPIPLAKHSFHSQIGDPYFYICPAIKDATKNVFAITFKFNETAKIDPSLLQSFESNDDKALHPKLQDWFPVTPDNKLLTCNRNSSLQGYVNFNYGRSWIFFADEPVVAKFTSPWLPATAPAPGAMVVPGQYDIGRWFRDFHVDYFVPTSTTSWTYTDKDPIFYIEIDTDRPVHFKRFDIRESEEIQAIANECMLTSQNFDKPYGLLKRYRTFKEKGHISTMLSELKRITK